MLVHDDPALGALFEHHGPAAVEVRRRALLGGDVRGKSDGVQIPDFTGRAVTESVPR